MSEALECILRRFAEELVAPSTDAMPNRIERMARRYAEEYGSEHDQPCDAIDVLRSIDRLRRDLSGYHGQLKAHNDLQRHCDRQREQLAALGAAHKPVKAERDAYKRQAERLAAENAKLREERDHWRVEQVHAYGNWEDTYKRASELEDENAKLRELLKNALTYIEYEGCGVECPETGNSATLTSCDACNRYETESCAYVIAQNARELGVNAE